MATPMHTSTRCINMSSLLTETLCEVTGQSPPPNKDWHHLAVTKSHVTWSWWNISRKYGKPGKLSESHRDFLDDRCLHRQVTAVFGCRILEYVRALCQGCYDYLERLPDPLLLRILAHLDLEDVGKLGKTSHRFRKLCGSEGFWEQAVRRLCDTVSDDMTSLAAELGWKRIFFTNKMQLRMQIRRRKNGPRHTTEVAGPNGAGLDSLSGAPSVNP